MDDVTRIQAEIAARLAHEARERLTKPAQEQEAKRQKLAAEAVEKARIARAEEELAAQKPIEMRKWLVEHPDKTRGFFESYIWPMMRENFMAGDMERLKQAKRQSTDYSL